MLNPETISHAIQYAEITRSLYVALAAILFVHIGAAWLGRKS